MSIRGPARRPASLAATAFAMWTLAACGGSSSHSTATHATASRAGGATPRRVYLNTKTVQRAIEQSILQQRRLHATVSCPGRILQQAGNNFICIAKVGGKSYPVAVTQTDSRGHVRYVVG